MYLNGWPKKDHIDPKESKQKKQPKQLETHNLLTGDLENINSTNKGRYLLLTNKLWIIPRGKERMSQRIQRHSRVHLHRSAHPKQSKTRHKNLAMAWIHYRKLYNVVPQSRIINCLKMYKISDEIINFIEKIMNTWRVELTAGERNLNQAKIQGGIFQGDARSPILFIIIMMSLIHVLRKCTAGYKLSTLQEKINHLMYMDDIKLFEKNEKKKKKRKNWKL